MLRKVLDSKHSGAAGRPVELPDFLDLARILGYTAPVKFWYPPPSRSEQWAIAPSPSYWRISTR
jgi:hypothetical protein